MVEVLPLAAVLMLSPGPASLATLALASRQGVRGVAPFATGVSIGYAAVAAAIAWLGGAFLSEAPAFRALSQLAGGLFVGWLGWRLLARGGDWSETQDQPGLVSGLALQMLNPKFPAVVLTLLAAGGPAGRWPIVLTLVGLGIAGQLLYATLGAATGRLAAGGGRRRWCDRLFGGTLILCGAWLVFSCLGSTHEIAG